jgi:hypothetical protein
MVMFTCDKGGWEWIDPERERAPGKTGGNSRAVRACAVLKVFLEFK